MNAFLSCDWGTSFLRLRLISIPDLQILAEERSSDGIANTYSLWKNSDNKNDNRLNFYINVLRTKVDALRKKVDSSLGGMHIVISGMASSSIGMLNINYAELPFAIDGSNSNVEKISAGRHFNHPILLISGIKSHDDVMRGEETQLVGIASEKKVKEEDGIYIFPGTHSKHITVRKGKVEGFKTYMTGEFFELLSKKSVLNSSVEISDGVITDSNINSFQEGVRYATNANLLHAAFHVRTNDLFGKYSKRDNLNFLSGLLIGTELQALNNESLNVYICCSSHLRPWYHAALEPLGLQGKVSVLPAQIAEEAVVRGQYKILEFNKEIQ